MPTIATLASAGACVLAALLTAGCGASSSPDGNATTTTPQAPTGRATSAPTPEPPTPVPPATERPAERWTMPDLVGASLQDAQDQIQALTGGAVYFTGSHDLGGQDRSQVVDANWTVCAQNVAPGAALTAASKVDFGVVKLGETCP